MAELTLTTRMREAIPDMPLAFRADRTLLALDLGTTTGWALHGADGLITSGTVSFRPGRFDGGGMRYLRFTNWLGELARLSGPIATIWFEEVRRHAGTDAAHVYGGLMATLTACLARGIACDHGRSQFGGDRVQYPVPNHLGQGPACAEPRRLSLAT